MDAYTKEIIEKMNKTIDALKSSLNKLRSARANPAMLNGIQCDYYGEKMDITSLCSISMPEPRQLLVKPYSREDMKTVASAIAGANLGINPQVEADCIRLIIPPLTEETRKDIAKKAKGLGDEAMGIVVFVPQSKGFLRQAAYFLVIKGIGDLPNKGGGFAFREILFAYFPCMSKSFFFVFFTGGYII